MLSGIIVAEYVKIDPAYDSGYAKSVRDSGYEKSVRDSGYGKSVRQDRSYSSDKSSKPPIGRFLSKNKMEKK